jgi:hypothetical protein
MRDNADRAVMTSRRSQPAVALLDTAAPRSDEQDVRHSSALPIKTGMVSTRLSANDGFLSQS